MKNNEAFSPRYDILPHGTAKQGNKVYAVFKIIVDLCQFNEPKGQTMDMESWLAFCEKVRTTKWYFRVDPVIPYDTSMTTQLRFSNDPKDGDLLEFFVRKNPYNVESAMESLPEFPFGRRAGNRKLESMDFLKTSKTRFELKPDKHMASLRTSAQLTQIDRLDPGKADILKEEDHKVLVRDTYTEILGKAWDYSGKLNEDIRNKELQKNNGLDFRLLYSCILDEPEAAQHHFGLIGEFRIDMVKYIEGISKIIYSIHINKGDSNKYFMYLRQELKGDVVGNEMKYYNGPERLCFKADDFVDGTVQCRYIDPYKGLLETQRQHPDGLYVTATYKDELLNDEISMIDPFDKEFMKGFVPLLGTKGGDRLFSITRHKKTLDFPKLKQQITYIASGHLLPGSELVLPDHDVRSNILLAWRGDNLTVNRVPERLKRDEEEQFDTVANTEDCREQKFAIKHILRSKENLVNGSQQQFHLNEVYRVILRPMTVTHFYLQSRAEQPIHCMHELTVEDFGDQVLPLNPNTHAEINQIPVKSATLVGAKTYRNAGSDFVDNKSHLVLSRNRKEKSERRYIFPPAMKFEDFRMLGFLSIERMTVGGKYPTKDEFVNRCLRLEGRIERKPPGFSWSRSGIHYLGDVRARQLVLVPSDLFTASLHRVRIIADAFAYQQGFPYYDGVKSGVLALKADNRISGKTGKPAVKLIFTTDNQQDNASNQQHPINLTDGIFNFNLYLTDNRAINPDNLKLYNPSPVRISIVNYPESRNLKQIDPKVKRNPAIPGTAINPDMWFNTISFAADADTWKSAKYQEETEVLRLDYARATDLTRDYYTKNPTHRVPLLFDEHPYEAFVVKEGSLDRKSGLRTDLYPESITIVYSITGKLPSEKFFALKLNDKEQLELVAESDGQYALRLNGDTKLGNSGVIKIAFVASKNCYEVQLNGESWVCLEQYLNADISIHDVEVPQEILPLLVFDNPPLLFSFTRSSSYTFVSNLGLPYFRRKRVKIFGSSIFQGYFPQSSSEFDMGIDGNEFKIEIPNNTLPKVPVYDADVLLMHTIDHKWKRNKGGISKQNTTESLIRITLSEDFMLEGENTLGIVVAVNDDSQDSPNPYVSRLGEDITKLSDTSWDKYQFMDIIDFNAQALLTKYIVDNKTTHYAIGAHIYEVLLFKPYFNARLKKWQVILPLISPPAVETFFMKIVALKVAKGHGLLEGTAFQDKSGTNLSTFGDPVQLPIYTKKQARVERQKDYYLLTMLGERKEGKLYYIILASKKFGYKGLNATRVASVRDNCVEFQLVGAGKTKGKGEIYLWKDGSSVQIQKTKCYSILLLEFDTHTNIKKLQLGQDFVSYNPLFANLGLRLTNVLEFKT